MLLRLSSISAYFDIIDIGQECEHIQGIWLFFSLVLKLHTLLRTVFRKMEMHTAKNNDNKIEQRKWTLTIMYIQVDEKIGTYVKKQRITINNVCIQVELFL